MQNHTTVNKVPDEIKRSRDLRGGRWNWTFKLAQKRSWGVRWSWAAKVGLLSLRAVQVVRQQQCNGHWFWAMARRHRLNTSIVLAAVHGLSGLFRAVSAVEPSLFRPLPSPLPSLISHLASVDVKQNGPVRRITCEHSESGRERTIGLCKSSHHHNIEFRALQTPRLGRSVLRLYCTENVSFRSITQKTNRTTTQATTKTKQNKNQSVWTF